MSLYNVRRKRPVWNFLYKALIAGSALAASANPSAHTAKADTFYDLFYSGKNGAVWFSSGRPYTHSYYSGYPYIGPGLRHPQGHYSIPFGIPYGYGCNNRNQGNVNITIVSPTKRPTIEKVLKGDAVVNQTLKWLTDNRLGKIETGTKITDNENLIAKADIFLTYSTGERCIFEQKEQPPLLSRQTKLDRHNIRLVPLPQEIKESELPSYLLREMTRSRNSIDIK